MNIVRSLVSVFDQLETLGLGEPRRRDDYLRKRPTSVGQRTGYNLKRSIELKALREKLKRAVELCSKKTTE